MKRILGVLAIAVIGLAVVSPASADGHAITIPLEEIYVTGAEGDLIAVGSADVDADMVGQACQVVATIMNQESIHPGNSMVVASGDNQVTISGIEDEAGQITLDGGTLVLAESISATVVLGPDGVTSLGSSMTLTCEPMEETPPPAAVTEEPTYTG